MTPASPAGDPAADRPTIRDAAPGDVPAIAELYAHHVRHGTASFELEPPSQARVGERVERAAARGLPYLVGEIDGRVVGYAIANPYRPRPAYAWTLEDSVYVAADRHGEGIGASLLTALLERAESAGFRQMVAVIGDSANAASIRLHEKLGFRHVGVLSDVGFKHGRWLDTVLMQRHLGAGGDSPPR